jgi:phage shock protein PspC (stress-responsive transcriptional regulator)
MSAIRKNSNTGLILGVCSGISEWTSRKGFLIHPHIIRAVFIVGLFFSIGIVGAIYLFLANTLTDEAECNIP